MATVIVFGPGTSKWDIARIFREIKEGGEDGKSSSPRTPDDTGRS